VFSGVRFGYFLTFVFVTVYVRVSVCVPPGVRAMCII
jgi:hypothetical protein